MVPGSGVVGVSLTVHTSEQILQQSVFLKFKYFVKFLQQHGQEVFAEVRTAYVETLSRIYRSALCASPWN